ncbi:MAG TPA: SAM-dependent methyltransferase [Saprospiraceae bacterium]|nr:SAM-dependent methyltransferase [Saprospiraceae bacterium]
MPKATNPILESLKTSLDDNSFVKLSLGNYKGKEANLKKLYIKRVLIKNADMLSFVYRYQTQDVTKNYTFAQAMELLEQLMGYKAFRFGLLSTLKFDEQIDFFKSRMAVKQLPASAKKLPSKVHNQAKNRKIEAKGKPYLHELGITDSTGKVYKKSQDKYRQINHYIEILSSLLKDLPLREKTNIVDMGAGKGYLTFALYDYLNHVLNKPSRVIGVEFRKNLVDFCNSTAQKSNFNDLHFEEGTIEQFETPYETHVLIALHACDTATDEAIYKGITGNADLIVVAPCCHHQIRAEIEKNKAINELDFLLKHGIFLERQAEMVTDGIRALILEYYGYSTKVFEFISDAHTPKNVLVVGKKRKNPNKNQAAILTKIQEIKAYFGIENHYLEVLLGLSNAERLGL